MQCPNGDGELIAHTTQGENNLVVSYSTCPTCRGYWMESFAANFIKLPPGDLQRTGAKLVHPPGVHLPLTPGRSDGGRAAFCPVCRKNLDRATGENIPDGIFVYQCPDHHGYFFPTGQLAAFKQAQKAKIAYHKLWSIPLPSVASVLLGGFILAILTGGLYATLTAIRQQQVTTSQAEQLLVSQNVSVSPETRAVLLSATTSVPATLVVHMPSLDNFQQELTTTNGTTHILFVPDIPTNTYSYYFTVTVNGRSSDSKRFEFTMPQ